MTQRLTGAIGTVAAVIGVVSCRRSPSSPAAEFAAEYLQPSNLPSLTHANLNLHRLVGQLVVSDAAIGSPIHMQVMGHLLWVSDATGEPFLHLIDLDSQQVIRSMGRRGQGPGDIGGQVTLTARPADSGAIWVYDAHLRRLTRISSTRDTSAVRMVQQVPNDDILQSSWLAADRILSIGWNEADRLMLQDSTGKTVRIVAGKFLGADSVSMRARQSASTSISVCVHPDGDRFAIAYLSAGRVDYFDSNADFLLAADVPYTGVDAFINRHGRWMAKTSRTYYRDCAATASHLYALFSGRSDRDFQPPSLFEATYLHVFDWEGRLTAIYWLDRSVSTIAAAKDGVIYASSDSTGGIYRYRLPVR